MGRDQVRLSDPRRAPICVRSFVELEDGLVLGGRLATGAGWRRATSPAIE